MTNGQKIVMPTVITPTNDTVVFSRRSGWFGLGANKFTLTEHGFLMMSFGLLHPQTREYDLRDATLTDISHVTLTGRNDAKLQLNTGDSIEIRNLYIRRFKEKLTTAIRGAQLEEREQLNNPKPLEYKSYTTVCTIIILLLILAALALIYIPKMIREGIQEMTVRDVKDWLNQLKLKQLFSKDSAVWISGGIQTHEWMNLGIMWSVYALLLAVFLPRNAKFAVSLISIIGVGVALAVHIYLGGDFFPELQPRFLAMVWSAAPLCVPTVFAVGILKSSEASRYKYGQAMDAGLFIAALTLSVRFLLADRPYIGSLIMIGVLVFVLFMWADIRKLCSGRAALISALYVLIRIGLLFMRTDRLSADQVNELNFVDHIGPILVGLLVFIASLFVRKFGVQES